MAELDAPPRTTLSEHPMLSRLAQSDQMREFFIQMWMQNPILARQGGSKAQNLLSPVSSAASGSSGYIERRMLVTITQ